MSLFNYPFKNMSLNVRNLTTVSRDGDVSVSGDVFVPGDVLDLIIAQPLKTPYNEHIYNPILFYALVTLKIVLLLNLSM